MTSEQQESFVARIQSLSIANKPKFGKMNVHQMVVHCTDQFRLINGEIESIPGDLSPEEVIAMAKQKITVPTPKGLDQVKGEGTVLTTFDKDKSMLLDYLNRFFNQSENDKLGDHPYLGQLDKTGWSRIVIYHLEHHLSQFGA